MTGGEYEGMVLAQIRRVGLQAQMVDPANPGERLRVGIEEREPVQSVALATRTTPSFSSASPSCATSGTPPSSR
jgi:hypothetical protein